MILVTRTGIIRIIVIYYFKLWFSVLLLRRWKQGW